MTAFAPGPAPARKDLVVLVADKNMEFALRGLFSRTPSFGIHPVTADVFVHPEKDPGCTGQNSLASVPATAWNATRSASLRR